MSMSMKDGQVATERHAAALGHELSEFRSISSFADTGDTWTQAQCKQCGMTFDVRWSSNTDECWFVARKLNMTDKWAKPMRFGVLPLTCAAALRSDTQGVWSFGLDAAA
jgi:hypothetical protein